MYIRTHTPRTLSCILATCILCGMQATNSDSHSHTQECKEKLKRCIDIADHIENRIFTNPPESIERPENFVQERCAEAIFNCYRNKIAAKDLPYESIYRHAYDLDTTIRRGSTMLDENGNIVNGARTTPHDTFPSEKLKKWTHLSTVGLATGTAVMSILARRSTSLNPDTHIVPKFFGGILTLVTGIGSCINHFNSNRKIPQEKLQGLAHYVVAPENNLPYDEQRSSR